MTPRRPRWTPPGARVLSLKATLGQMRSQVMQGRAVLVHTQDILHKTVYTSPINGL